MSNIQSAGKTPSTVAALVVEYVRKRGGVAEGEHLSPHAHLFDEGYLDSLGTLGLIALLEETFALALPAELLMDPRFSSAHGIAELVVAFDN